MRPSQVLDMQGDLLSRFDDVRFAQTAANWFVLDLGATARDMRTRQWQEGGHALAGALRNHVNSAYAFRVTEDMSYLVQHAATALDETDTFDASAPPTGTGLVRFDRPLEFIDVRGRTMKAHWLTWGPAVINGVPRILLTWFNDTDDPDDVQRIQADEDPEHAAYARTVLGRWGWIGADFATHGAELGSEVREPDAEKAAQIIADGHVPTAATSGVRYAMALWMLLGQTITSVEDEEVDRAAARRAKRMNLPPRVTVIQLRRAKGSAKADGETMVEWHHRWITRGHWRWQRCGEGLLELRRIWISPYVKGPEGAPLKVSDKVYDLSR